MESTTGTLPSQHRPQAISATGLGIDMGGTQTRWALADQAGTILSEGAVDGATALQLGNLAGQAALQALFSSIAQQLQRATDLRHQIFSLQAGLTGYSGDATAAKQMLGSLFALPESAIHISNDIEIAYLDTFQPGEGYLVYAGTGSIAAYIDQAGNFHRAGGHGYVLDDAGSGYWIAREALKRIWREEDFHPGAWRSSPMATAMFALIGGAEWKHTREFIYQRSRGEVGKLALALGTTADMDRTAYTILENAGIELARLARALCHRFGQKPIALSGRVQELHPIIAETMKKHLHDTSDLRLCENLGHHSAARIAASRIPQGPERNAVRTEQINRT
ncbi:N-acetylglucosamine kinase [Undibacterium sp. Ji22W]|uniref:N-acetylglucosamine kinase n=1 Tax=Undibacterium sp. Ji22W TaxID=3413038 RepID=UPI003BF2E449